MYPLLTAGTFSQDVFKLSFKECEGCKLHQSYVEILRAMERERKASEERRRQEMLKKQEEHAYHIRLIRERDRMLAAQFKRQQQLQVQLKNLQE